MGKGVCGRAYLGGRGGLGKEVCALDPTILAGDEFWGDSVFVGAIWGCATGEEGANDGEMTVGGSEMERGRARSADYGGCGVAIAV